MTTGVRLPSGAPLIGRYLRLDPLADGDLDELGGLLRDPALYANGYVMHRCPTSAADARSVAEERFLARDRRLDGRGGGRLPYAIRLVDESALGPRGTFVGTSALLEADLVHERIHLGSTLYGRRWWGTVVNPQAKLLLLAHCFDECGFGRVKIQTDALNTRSQAAIARLGAQREGVARRDMKREDGTFRDSVVFSIVGDGWPGVRAGLQARLG